jgi:hypothetical protein
LGWGGWRVRSRGLGGPVLLSVPPPPGRHEAAPPHLTAIKPCNPGIHAFPDTHPPHTTTHHHTPPHTTTHNNQDDVEVKLMMGDELRLRHKCPAARPPWEGTGHVINTGGSSEEVRGVGGPENSPLCHHAPFACVCLGCVVACLSGNLGCVRPHLLQPHLTGNSEGVG